MSGIHWVGTSTHQLESDKNVISQNEGILPSQWVARLKPNALTPEQALLCHVLIDAIQCFQLVNDNRQCPSAKETRLHLEAKMWIFDDGCTSLFTFVRVCEALDIDPSAIRTALLKWKESGDGPIRIERTVRHSNGAHPTAIRDRVDKLAAVRHKVAEFHKQGCSIDEIAEACGISRRAVFRRLNEKITVRKDSVTA